MKAELQQAISDLYKTCIRADSEGFDVIFDYHGHCQKYIQVMNDTILALKNKSLAELDGHPGRMDGGG